MHRLPSLTILWVRCLAAPPTGRVVASVADLPGLLAAAGRAAPQLRILEDFTPADPRLVVRYAVDGNRFRIHPGSLGDPVQTLRVLTATAEAIDPFVIERHGFSLSDLIEVAAVRSQLHELEVILDDDGQFAVTGALPEPAGTAIDTASYQRAERADCGR